LKNKGFKEERVAKVRADDLNKSTTLESNKSQSDKLSGGVLGGVPIRGDRYRNTLIFSIFSRGFTRYRDTTRWKTIIVFPGHSEYRIRVREGELFWKRP
jgi:hypothetical protein